MSMARPGRQREASSAASTMTSAEYDVDSSGGLMTKIQALIAPPENDEASKSNKKKEGLDLHPYYKRPGKGHNRDCCDACSEGGNLICCDKCPASFHLGCHDPPLQDDDIPLGQWLCHKCRMSAGLPALKEILKKAANPSETSDGPTKEEPADTPSRGRSRTSSTASMESNKSRGRGRAAAAAAAAQPTGPITTTSVATGPDGQSALDTLIAAASSMNPIQFDLPREMVLPINFPGTDRAPTRGKRASASKRSRTHELDNGLVPLPAKTCFECRKSCKRAPLLACDYCPLLFHLDCLDPPLTSLPCGRWMCPNHVEQAIDEKLLTSLSVTQRVALWDKYTGPIDQDTIKTEFLQKTRRQNPPFRFKVKLAPRNRAKVPNSVKEMYKNRPPLVPSLRDVLRDSEVNGSWADIKAVAPESKVQDAGIDGPTETEQEEWLSGIVALQTSIACHLSTKRRKMSQSSDFRNQDAETLSGRSDESDGIHIKKETIDTDLEFKDLKGNTISNGLSDHSDQITLEKEDVESSKTHNITGLNGSSTLAKVVTHASKIQNGDTDTIMEIDDESSEASDKILEKSTSLTSGKEQDKKKIKKLLGDKVLLDGLTNLLEDSLDCEPVSSVDKLDERLIRLLALQRLQQLSANSSLSDCLALPTKTPSLLVQRQPTFWPAPEAGLKPRALLTPLNSCQPPMPIYYRVMEVGTGGDMDICLTYYGHCNYVTAKHAVIICDEVNRHYELMNYSEHGTTVDNVLYSCDFSEKVPVKDQPMSPPLNPPHHGRRSGGSSSSANTGTTNAAEPAETEVEVPPLIQKIRAVVDKRRGVVREEDNAPEPCKMPSDIGKVDMKCSCRSSSSSLIGGSGAGWEGTALLNHGSFIKFGCIQFTFSVLNFVSPPQREQSAQESSSVTVTSGKGPIPHRILKRERDSTSSSTLTVSPSPPPDRAAQPNKSVQKSSKKREVENDDDDDDDDDDDEEEDEDEDEEEGEKEELNDDSEVEENEDDENMEESNVVCEDVAMEESLVETKEKANNCLPDSSSVNRGSPCALNETDSV
ncbi:PHD finger protein 12 [Thrips palmi]|uniref:PHD finger protein 12 n=1 Tax=Thrips palmi TaxID=161013 RepID=A0A6P8YH38_THRPL|nr:PHD finger protein 12 [Thrips palmi]